MLEPRQLRLLDSFPALRNDTALVQALSRHASTATLAAGQTICREGESCHQLALVTRGSARVFKLAESGREITLYRVEPGECCILTASCMLSGRTFPASAAVEDALEAILVPNSRVVGWMKDHAAWQHYLWELLATRLGDVIGLVEEVAFRRVDRRLADYLIEHAGTDLLLRTTHHQVAADLGTSREVISRILKDFQLRGYLEVGRGCITLKDLDGIRGERD